MRAFSLITAILAVFLIAAPPALAGGPTSVLISSPTEHRVAALYTTQTAYTELMDTLGANPTTADPQAPPTLHGGPGSRAINVTWLIHDVQVWRVDRVFLDYPGGPWVETFQSHHGSVTFNETGIMHRPAKLENLAPLFNAILGPPDAQNVQQPVRSVVTPPPPPAPMPVAAASGIQWTSLAIGLVGGVVLAFFGRVIFGTVRRTST